MAALLFASLVLQSPAHAQSHRVQLDVVGQEGNVLMSMPMGNQDHWCLLWNHSVAGFTVSDCFANDHTNLRLHASHQPDFAAGLGYLQGRGKLASDGQGGYWITEINEPLPDNALTLRVGSEAVNHRLVHGDQEISLSEIAAGQRVTLRLSPR